MTETSPIAEQARAMIERLKRTKDGGTYLFGNIGTELRNPDGPAAAAIIAAQAAEIDRLQDRIVAMAEALGLADAVMRGANMNMNVVERKVKAALTPQEQS